MDGAGKTVKYKKVGHNVDKGDFKDLWKQFPYAFICRFNSLFSVDVPKVFEEEGFLAA